jgi:hypothetical protein
LVRPTKVCLSRSSNNTSWSTTITGI